MFETFYALARTKTGVWSLSIALLFFAIYLNGIAQVYADRYISAPFDPARVLPDIIFDNLPFVKHSAWIDWCIVLTLALVVAALWMLTGRLFNRYLRRLVIVEATLFLIRAPVLVFTTLPKPADYCDPHAVLSSNRSIFVDAILVVITAYQSCSDVFFSGHATNLMVAMLGWWTYVDALSRHSRFAIWWRVALGIVTACTGAALLLIVMMHFHYTIDVVIAVMLASFVFFVYYACYPLVRTVGPVNPLPNFVAPWGPMPANFVAPWGPMPAITSRTLRQGAR